jgi:hypothetical protein
MDWSNLAALEKYQRCVEICCILISDKRFRIQHMQKMKHVSDLYECYFDKDGFMKT